MYRSPCAICKFVRQNGNCMSLTAEELPNKGLLTAGGRLQPRPAVMALFIDYPSDTTHLLHHVVLSKHGFEPPSPFDCRRATSACPGGRRALRRMLPSRTGFGPEICPRLLVVIHVSSWPRRLPLPLAATSLRREAAGLRCKRNSGIGTAYDIRHSRVLLPGCVLCTKCCY